MNEREKILTLQAQLAELLAENVALKLAAAKAENEALKATVADLETQKAAAAKAKP